MVNLKYLSWHAKHKTVVYFAKRRYIRRLTIPAVRVSWSAVICFPAHQMSRSLQMLYNFIYDLYISLSQKRKVMQMYIFVKFMVTRIS